jgi:hypothetical protein
LKARSSINLHEPILQRAKILMHHKGFPTLTGFVEQLIREEWERQSAKGDIADAAAEMLMENGDSNYRSERKHKEE